MIGATKYHLSSPLLVSISCSQQKSRKEWEDEFGYHGEEGTAATAAERVRRHLLAVPGLESSVR